MASSSKHEEITVQLHQPEDWDRWEHAFRNLAESKKLWSHIEQDTTLEEPVKPSLEEVRLYTRAERTPDPTPESSTTARSRAVAGKAPRTRRRALLAEDDEESVTPEAPLRINRDEQALLTSLIQMYNIEEREYAKQEKPIAEIKDWCLKTVSPDHYQIACDQTKSLSEWYSNLKVVAGVDDATAEVMARTEYREALKPLIRPRDWTTWLQTWQKAMTRAERRGIPEATKPSIFV